VKKSAWTKLKISKLLALVEASPSKSRAFAQIAKQMGLKPASVRNFFYKYQQAENPVPFKKQKFTKPEIRAFLREIILGYSRGESVRSICLTLAEGDRARMLRYQNKYRQIRASDQPLINQTVAALEKEGYIVKSPLPTPQPADILSMPVPNYAAYHNLTDQDITNLFMGLVRLVRKQGESQIEKLRAEIERLKRNEQQTTNK